MTMTLSFRDLNIRHLVVILVLVFFSGCEKKLELKAPAAGAVAVFEEVWKVIDQRYALFPVKKIDWNAVHARFLPLITESLSQQQLFRVIASMLDTLQDGHISLISNNDTATYENFYKPFARNFNFLNISLNYLRNDYQTSGPLIYKISNNIGYLYSGSFIENSTDAQLDKVFSDIQDTKGLIVDVRSNTGGASLNAEKLFSRFISDRMLVKYELRKKGAGHDDFSDPIPGYISPATSFIYSKPVAVLTNRTCFSSCNDFVLYMSNLPNVTLLGDQTGGGGGLPQNYVLANGWKLQYTATQTLSPAKESIENGIRPDVNLSINSIDESNGKDPILEFAYQSLQ